jgi:hypothetical protein
VGDPPARGVWCGDNSMGSTDWINLAEDTKKWQAPLNVLMNDWVPLNFTKLLSCRATGGSSN